MKTAIILLTLSLASVAAAQTSPTDFIAVNAPLAAFAEQMDSRPGAHPCGQRAALLMKAGKLRLQGGTRTATQAALGSTVNAYDAVAIVYAALMPKSIADVQLLQFTESSKCAIQYGLTQGLPYDPAHPTPPNKAVGP